MKAALVAGERRLDAAEADARANRAARALARLGVGAGDRVAVALRNRVEFFEATAAAGRLLAPVVPVSWRAKADEVRYLTEDSGARLLLAEPDEPDPGAGVPVLRVGDDYESALAAESPDPLPGSPDPPYPDLRYYTSGTTGRPKRVERATSPDPAVRAEGSRAYARSWDVGDPDGVHLVTGPLYHTAPCAYAHHARLLGQTVVVMERFDAEECLRLIEAEGVTWTHMVPINFVRILALPREVQARYDLSSIHRVLHAAAPCPVDVKRRILELFPPGTVWEYYGMTEGLATVISPEEWLRKPGSVGRAAPGLDVRVLDEEGRELGPGEIGLVYVSAPGGNRFEYAGAPAKTAEAWRGERFTVGDMGFLDEDGYLFLSDRKQDLIISGGANVYPAEVEAVLFGHPAIADVAVIGVPDEEWGEAVKAVVEAREMLDPGEVIAFCRERLAHYKCPRTVDVVEALPRDPNGKLLKRELRERYWAGRDRRI
jgi:long-chain acyl-CoA synthetase